jgi:hypothetical protein
MESTIGSVTLRPIEAFTFASSRIRLSGGTSLPTTREEDRVLKNYAPYYNQVRTHLSLDKNAPDFRRPQKPGSIASISILGGLHPQYVRL